MSLKGSLDTVALPEVLRFLAGTAKTGELQVSGPSGGGRLWFEAGALTGIHVGRTAQSFDAMFELMRVADGEFTFVAGESRPEDSREVAEEDRDVASALEQAELRLAEWRDIEAVVPGLAHRLSLVADPDRETITLERAQWSLLVSVAAGCSVLDVLEARDLSEFEGCRLIRDLVESGLLEISEPAPPAVGADEETVVDEQARVEDEAVDAQDGAEVGEAPVAVDGDFSANGHDPAGQEPDGHDPAGQEPDDLAAATAGYQAEHAFAMNGYGVDQPKDAWADESGDGGEEFTSVAPHDLRFGSSSWNGDSSPESDDMASPYLSSELTFALTEALASEPADDDTESSPEVADRYAALRAAMLDVGDDFAEPAADPEGAEAAPVYAFPEEAVGEGRAALEALLSEVASEPAAYADEVAPYPDEPAPYAHEVVDGLADRGPWTAGELAGFDQSDWSGAVPAGPDGAVESLAYADSGEAVATEAEEEPEPVKPVEEPMNRGLLLKFLSSVRN